MGHVIIPVSKKYDKVKQSSRLYQKNDPDNALGSLDSRRTFFSFQSRIIFGGFLLSQVLPVDNNAIAADFPPIDVNNAMAREFTAFPGLYPTIATKIVNAAKKKPFKSKADVYAALDTDVEKERLKLYDSSIKIQEVDKALQQFKGSQICKYECGGRVSSSYRDEQIKSVQAERAVGK